MPIPNPNADQKGDKSRMNNMTETQRVSIPKTPIEEGFERIFGKMKNIDTPEDTELYQKITDICFENGGVTKPMVDKLMNLITLHTKKAEQNGKKFGALYAKQEIMRENENDALENIDSFIKDIRAQLTNPAERKV